MFVLDQYEEMHGDVPLENPRVRMEDLQPALNDAIEDSDSWLRDAYDTAVQKYQDKYEYVLWSVADHWELFRSTDQIWSSYERICGDMKKLPADRLERKELSLSLNALKQPNHGQALVSNRRSWFKFRQAMLRGYCRIVAASKGIQVGLEYLQTPPLRLSGSNGGGETETSEE